jgi:hypothetical protein
MQSREFGFGFAPTLAELSTINLRREGNKYTDEESAMSLFGNANKKKLTESPFIRKLEIGIRKEGYWKYMHMCIQFEDCIDCIRYVSENRGWD